jgi:hypothetical protein
MLLVVLFVLIGILGTFSVHNDAIKLGMSSMEVSSAIKSTGLAQLFQGTPPESNHQYRPTITQSTKQLYLTGFQSASFVAAGASVSLTSISAYSSTGFVSLNYYVPVDGQPDLTCSTEFFVVMYPVNYCFPTSTYAIKLQLSEGKLSDLHPSVNVVPSTICHLSPVFPPQTVAATVLCSTSQTPAALSLQAPAA